VLQHLTAYGLDAFFATQLDPGIDAAQRLARVIAVQRSELSVVRESGDLRVSLSAELRRGQLVDRPTVGDWVVLNARGDTIEGVLERRSLFRRAAAGRGDEVQPIAANVDTVFVLSACNEEFKESRLERYLALCREAGALPVVVLTKSDLAENPESYRERALALQQDLAVLTVNALDSSSLEALQPWLDAGRTVTLAGSSGVGKSTLLNSLAGSELAATRGVRLQDQRGRHTTTHRALYRLPSGALLIDVPGMRELRVAEVDEALDEVFDDIEELALVCRFSDCAHESEPGCAVNRAIDEGHLDARRLASYRKLRAENREATASIEQKRSREKRFSRDVDAAKARKAWRRREP
jgi:ribosome biogenesis GTPase